VIDGSPLPREELERGVSSRSWLACRLESCNVSKLACIDRHEQHIIAHTACFREPPRLEAKPIPGYKLAPANASKPYLGTCWIRRIVSPLVASYSPAGATPRDEPRGPFLLSLHQSRLPGQMLPAQGLIGSPRFHGSKALGCHR
jgi:hypothetical protein